MLQVALDHLFALDLAFDRLFDLGLGLASDHLFVADLDLDLELAFVVILLEVVWDLFVVILHLKQVEMYDEELHRSNDLPEDLQFFERLATVDRLLMMKKVMQKMKHLKFFLSTAFGSHCLPLLHPLIFLEHQLLPFCHLLLVNLLMNLDDLHIPSCRKFVDVDNDRRKTAFRLIVDDLINVSRAQRVHMLSILTICR